MSAFSLQITEAVARLLTPAEREAVLGDLAEARCGLWRSLAEVLGFAARRQIFLWRSWRPWAASCGLALPVSLFLGGFSLGTVSTVLKWAAFPSDDSLFWSCLFHTVLLLCWAQSSSSWLSVALAIECWAFSSPDVNSIDTGYLQGQQNDRLA